MKPLKYTFLFLASLAILSCSEDEGNPSITAESIIGSWELIGLDSENEASGELFGLPFTSESTTVGDNFDYILTFADSTYTAGGSYDITTTGTINGIPFDPDMESFDFDSQTGNYAIENNQIIFEDFFLVIDEIPEEDPDAEFNIETFIDGNGDLIINQSLDVDVELMEEGVLIPFRAQIDGGLRFRRIE